MVDGTGGAGVASAPSILGKDRGSPCSFKISCNTITCTLSMLESSYTGRGRINKGPFKYYVIKELGGWGQKMAIFDDLQYCKSSKS